MNILFSNPCFVGDVLCTIPPIHVWKKRTGANITILYEKTTQDKEPISILREDPNIDAIHCLPFNTIPRTSKDGKIVKIVTDGWFEDALHCKFDKIFDLHQHWTGSNGENWFRCSDLNFKEDHTPLRFFPSKESLETARDFQGYVGVSDRVPHYDEIIKVLQAAGYQTVRISQKLGLNLMDVYCVLSQLQFFITACCLHNTLCWATSTPNYVMWTAASRDIHFDYQNKNTTIIQSCTKEELYDALRTHKRI